MDIFGIAQKTNREKAQCSLNGNDMLTYRRHYSHVLTKLSIKVNIFNGMIYKQNILEPR